MWILKFKVFDKDCIYATKISKLGLQAYEQILTHYKKGDSYYFMSVHILVGESKLIKKYVNLMKNDNRVKKIEVDGERVIELVQRKIKNSELEVYMAGYNPEIVMTRPGFVDSDGWEYYEFASFNRNILMNFIKILEKHYHFALLNLKETKKYELYIPKLLPKLSEKQKNAISLAVQNGYYNFPRKIDIIKLSKLSKISFSTFREHLRKAESKLIPLMHKDYFLK
jgi:predicted DNA binding protein